jgi:hypothetical protein
MNKLLSDKRSFLASLLLLCGTMVFTPTCDEVDAAFDCQSVCSKYRTCFDANYDVGACRSRCRDNARNDDSYRQKADDCESCIDGMSCAGSAISCTGCVGIVP